MNSKRFNEKGQLIVGENFCCEHWEPDDGALVPMKECWCCKWASFKTDSNDHMSEGVCGYVGNGIDAVQEDGVTVIS
jgi:hypothetical protein